MTPLENYLRELRDIHYSGGGTKEPSYYVPLANLLNEIGKTLKPKVRCIMQLANRGAGFPDGGLFTPDQFQKARQGEPLLGLVPSRGVIEVKGTVDDAWVRADGEQVTRYWGRYHQVLVTNLRDFLLVGQDAEGNPAKLESYSLADSEAAFWSAAAHPRKAADAHNERFVEFLKRVMLHAAPLTAPEDVAWLLASYAREARARIERMDLPALTGIREALEEALGLEFEGERGDHFFRSTLVQTLFYGIFSAWVLWGRQHPSGDKARFNWHEASWFLRVPMIKALFEQVATPTKLGPLGLVEVLDWTGAALNRVDRASFFAKFEEDHAVQYFYEPFLRSFDRQLAKDLGVWYTPPEIVKYMVARVDTVLRRELGLADGLADPNVYVLDPCCGTGAYLVEVLKRIGETLAAKGADALLGSDVKQAAMERVFGFEILPAPFVVSHLQLGLLLQNLGAPLVDGGNERVGVYLTNSLTGWEPLDPEKEKAFQAMLTGFPELLDERDRSRNVKQEAPILVILGNPPYSGFAGVSLGEERVLTEAYRESKATRQPQGQGLNDLYVRFFRMAERRITEQTGRGVVCFISNYSWLDSLSCPAMRERYLEEFDGILIDCLNGDKFKTGKLTPDGKPDPSIFSTEWNPEGIQIGTAIALLVRKDQHQGASAVGFRHLWGTEKRAELLATAVQDGISLYQEIVPPVELGFPFMPLRVVAGYFTWPLLSELFEVSFPGVKTSRDDVVVDIDRIRLVERMERYFDPAVSHEEVRRIVPTAMKSTDGFDGEAVRDRLQKRGFVRENVVRYCYRPFDLRWLYWEPETNLLDRKREDYFPQVFKGNVWIEARQRQPMEQFDRGYVVRVLGDNFGNGLSSFFPLWIRQSGAPGLFSRSDSGARPMEGSEVEAQAKRLRPNLHQEALRFVCSLLKVEPYLSDGQTPSRDACRAAEAFFFHAVAVLRCPAYQSENAGALRQDWPRIPLPSTRHSLITSADLGRHVASLLDPEQPVQSVTAGAIRAELRLVAVISRKSGGSLDPAAGELAVTAGWGYAGQGGVVMPGKGQVVEREYTPEERAAIEKGAKALGLSAKEAFTHLGQTTNDVYLNDRAYWANIPARVWGYTIGGYQVMKKWLSYREQDLLGRPLSPNEAREVQDMARRIAAILLAEPQLDANFRAVKEHTYSWPGPA